VNVDNYGLILVDLKNVGSQCVTQVFYVLDAETGKHVIVSKKQKIIEVENVKDNDEDVNQFEDMSLFTNLMNVKHIEKDFDKNLILYMRKGGKEKFA
jgi:hypothetical protein